MYDWFVIACIVTCVAARFQSAVVYIYDECILYDYIKKEGCMVSERRHCILHDYQIISGRT